MIRAATAKSLADLCEFRNGLWKGKKSPYVHVGIIRNTNFNADGSLDESDIAYHDVEEKQLKSRQLKFGDIILEKSGGGPKQPVGRVITFERHDGPYSFSNFTSLIRVRDPEELDFRYLHRVLFWYYTAGVTEGMQRRSTGIRNLDFNAYKQLEIPLLPLPEQRRIVGILDEAFDGIATAKANAEKNLQNAHALFESHLNAVFAKTGDGWTESALVDLCSVFFDSAHRTPKYQDEGIPALRPRDVVNGVVDLKRAARVSKSEYEIQCKRYQPSPGDLVYSRELSYGWAAIIPDSETICLSQGMCVFRPRNGLSAKYLAFVLNSPFGRSQAFSAAVGAAHPHINLTDIKSYKIPMYPSGQESAILNTLLSLEGETQRLASIYQRKLAALDELKKSLLHQAFSGQL
jgi:type I restriction enzyme S subunit